MGNLFYCIYIYLIPGAATFNLTAGGLDIFISKLDASGNFVWAKDMEGTVAANGFSIAVDAQGNVYATGSFSGTVDFDPGAGTFNLTAAGAAEKRGCIFRSPFFLFAPIKNYFCRI